MRWTRRALTHAMVAIHTLVNAMSLIESGACWASMRLVLRKEISPSSVRAMLKVNRIVLMDRAQVVQDHAAVDHQSQVFVLELILPEQKTEAILPATKGLLDVESRG